MRQPNSQDQQTAIVAVGEFDGFHVGHRTLAEAARRLARTRRLPLAAVVLDSPVRRELLMSPEDRCTALLDLGFDVVRVLEVAAIDESVIVVDEVRRWVQPEAVVMNCAPGPQPRVTTVAAEFRRAGIQTFEVPREHTSSGSEVTSEKLRQLLRAADLGAVEALTGRPFSLSGVVRRGAQLGRVIGTPTANVELPPRMLMPPNGVYACQVTVDGRTWATATNVGLRPTVEHRDTPVVEAHLIGFDGDLYGCRLTVEFRAFVRSERQFAGLDELSAQIRDDLDVVGRRLDELSAG